MKKIFLLFITTLLTTFIFAQNDARIAQGLRALNYVPQQLMPAQNNEALLAKEMSERRRGRANHFAVPMQVHITPDSHGVWEQTPEGVDVWRLRIASPTAKSLNLGFTKYIMPKAGSLILYTSDYQEVRGPFTPYDNAEHEQLWTPVLQSDEIVIEVQLPLGNRHELQLELSAVNHDFVGFQEIVSSGACNLDVICGAEDGWEIVDNYRDIIQSVAFTHVLGFANCTGFLVNNTGQDCKPYFMTAHHCDVPAEDAPSLVTYWNFQNSECRQPNSTESGQDGDGMLSTFNSGSRLVSSYEPSDFVLVELDQPVVQEADAFFAGWTAEPTLPTSAIAIHHPSNCEKRISFENDNDFYVGTWAGGPDNIPDGDHVVVADWDIGTTEGGSSGSPLFDQNKRVIGQLHGGGAACGNDNYDTYGWFHSSWEGGGTPETRLKDWLDPLNSGILTMDGNNCGLNLANTFLETCTTTQSASVEVSVGAQFSSNVSLSLSGVPVGINASFEDSTISPNSSTELNLSNLNNLSSGFYSIQIEATDGNVFSNSILNIQVTEPLTTTPTLLQPSNLAFEVPALTIFNWSVEENAPNSRIQLSKTPNFSEIVESANTNELSFMGNILEPSTTYYWRIRQSNACGQGNWSSVFSFTTANTICDQVAATTGLPLEIDDGPTGVYESIINIPNDGKIEDINVTNINGTHTYSSDLTVSLISPAGTSVLLWDEECGDSDNFMISFDDSAASGNFPCPMTNGMTYQPAGNLADFKNENQAGDWILQIEDGASQDGGELQNWGLQICATLPSISFDSDNYVVCNDQPFEFSIIVGNGFFNTVTLTPVLPSNAPFKITYDADINAVPPGTVINAMIADFTGIELGEYSVGYLGNDGSSSVESLMTIQLIDMPTTSTLMLPLDEATDVAIDPTFTWNVATGSGYFIEIATDGNFDNIVHTNAVQGTSYKYPDFLEDFMTYHWRITTLSECGEVTSDVFTFTTGNLVPVEETLESQINIYPNPTSGLLNIELEGAFQESLLFEIYSLNGQQMIQSKSNPFDEKFTLDLSNVPKGIYLLKIKHSKGMLSKRIVVQ